MNKLIKLGTKVIVQTSDGKKYVKENISKEEFFDLSENIEDSEFLLEFFMPEYKKYKEETREFNQLTENTSEVPFLSYKNSSYYWEEISPLSLPEDFVKAITKAYQDKDKKALKAYKNFWILLSLNPSDECRKNLWWFLNRHDLKISSSGFFVGYRNVVKTGKTDEEGNPIYTDDHTHSFKIQIGKTVSMPREDCDKDNTVVCSSGLHLGGSKWLEQNYCGDVGIVVLVNPYNVTSLPQESTYGKCRCCEYLPIGYATFENKKIVPYDVEMGFECPYAAQAIYEGIITVEDNKYEIKAPVFVEKEGIMAEQATNNLLELAKECLLNKDYTVYDK